MKATALVADDEPLLRERLCAQLGRLWPALEIVAQARSGREALDAMERFAPDLAFLDVQMPGQSGIEAARQMQGRCHIVFVTAFERYAVEAFEQGAVDYLVKPIDEQRLALCLTRVQQRLADASARDRTAASAPASSELGPLLSRLEELLPVPLQARRPLQWIKASVGSSVKLIPVDEVAFLRSDDKYTLVAWSGGEALIRKPIRELVLELDATSFVQVHRSAIVNLRHVAQVLRGPNETADIHLRGRPEVLPVSRNFLHHFRQM